MEKKEYYTKKEVILWALEQDTIRHIKKAMARYGIEGTEEKIKELYKLMPKCRDYMLSIYYNLIKEK